MADHTDSTTDLLEAMATALRAIAPLEAAIGDDLEPQQYRALAEAQEALALAYTRDGGTAIPGICAMCGQKLPGGPPYDATACGHCERSYGPEDQDE